MRAYVNLYTSERSNTIYWPPFHARVIKQQKVMGEYTVAHAVCMNNKQSEETLKEPENSSKCNTA